MNKINYAKRFPTSKPCACDICVSYCKRPGWWTMDKAALAIEGGYGSRIMLEMSPELTFDVPLLLPHPSGVGRKMAPGAEKGLDSRERRPSVICLGMLIGFF